MLVEVVLPSLGEDDDAVQGASLCAWLAKPGAQVEENADLLEITTDKAAFVVPSPCAGTLVELRVKEGADIQVGQVLCILEVKES